MNKNKNPKRRASVARRPMPIILSLIVAIIACIIVAKLLASSTSDSPLPPAANITVEQGTTSGNSTTHSDEKSHITPVTDNVTGEKHIPQYEGSDPNTSESLTGSITAARIVGQNYVLTTTINQYLTSGTCHLEFSGNDTVHTEDVEIIPSASSSTCKGFDIPLKSLSSGTYTYNISLSSGDRTGTITGEVTL